MTQYIDKSAVVAEINRVLNSYDPNEITSGRYALVSLRDFLDTLETKEVDLEKEEDKLNKAIKLADAMYDAAQQLTTDASRLRKAMRDWWKFRNFSL